MAFAAGSRRHSHVLISCCVAALFPASCWSGPVVSGRSSESSDRASKHDQLKKLTIASSGFSHELDGPRTAGPTTRLLRRIRSDSQQSKFSSVAQVFSGDAQLQASVRGGSRQPLPATIENAAPPSRSLPLPVRRCLLVSAILVLGALLCSWLRHTWCRRLVIPESGLPDGAEALMRQRHVLQGSYHLEVFLEMTLTSVIIPSSYDLVHSLGYGLVTSGWLIGVGYVFGTVGAFAARFLMNTWHQASCRSAVLTAQSVSIFMALTFAFFADPPGFVGVRLSSKTVLMMLMLTRLVQGGCIYFTGTLLKMMGVIITPTDELTSYLVYQNSARNLGIGAGPLLSAISVRAFRLDNVRSQAAMPVVVVAALLIASQFLLRSTTPDSFQELMSLLRAKRVENLTQNLASLLPGNLGPTKRRKKRYRSRSITPPATPSRTPSESSSRIRGKSSRTPPRTPAMTPPLTPKRIRSKTPAPDSLRDDESTEEIPITPPLTPKRIRSKTPPPEPLNDDRGVEKIPPWLQVGLEDSHSDAEFMGVCSSGTEVIHTGARLGHDLPSDPFTDLLRRSIWMASVRSSCQRAFISMALESAMTQLLEVIWYFSATEVGLMVGFAFVVGTVATPLIEHMWTRTAYDSPKVLCSICVVNVMASLLLFPTVGARLAGTGLLAVLPMLIAVAVITPLGYHAMGIAEALALEFSIPGSYYNAQNLSLLYVVFNTAVSRFMAPPFVRYVLHTSGQSAFAFVVFVCTMMLCFEAVYISATVNRLRTRASRTCPQVLAVARALRVVPHSGYDS